jgi:pimeloyl-ACP methyl ester carboxylesterase
MRRLSVFLLAALSACSSSSHGPVDIVSTADGGSSAALQAWAGFIDVPPRTVSLHGRSISIDATARLFANFWPADETPENKPLFILFNGFAADVVRGFGTGPATVDESGNVVANPTSFTQIANLLYIDPRQSGFSYDVPSSSAPTASDCSADVFNEYVDAGDMLFAVMTFLDAHPNLKGPIVWVGESYAGVRITWMLSGARDRWNTALYDDASLRTRLANFSRRKDLANKQILLEPWLMGKAHADAIAAECSDPKLLAGVSTSLPNGCSSTSACDCASAADRSLYDYALTNEVENDRLLQADQAQVTPADAQKLLGVSLTSIAGLSAADRGNGFKCSSSDDSTPNEDAITAALGALPPGQNYFLPFSPLTPGKGTTTDLPDWENTNDVGAAFVDNLQDVPTLVTDGQLDLVVPESALVPALQTVIGAQTVTENGNTISVSTSVGTRAILISRYPNAGHMITMAAPSALDSDIRAWLGP